MLKKKSNKNKAAARPKPRRIITPSRIDWSFAAPSVWVGPVEQFLDAAPAKPIFDLIVTSPPYNIGKEYERREKTAGSAIVRRVILFEYN